MKVPKPLLPPVLKRAASPALLLLVTPSAPSQQKNSEALPFPGGLGTQSGKQDLSKSTWSSKQHGLRLECVLLAEGVHDLKAKQDQMARELKQEKVGPSFNSKIEMQVDGAISQQEKFSVHVHIRRITRRRGPLTHSSQARQQQQGIQASVFKAENEALTDRCA